MSLKIHLSIKGTRCCTSVKKCFEKSPNPKNNSHHEVHEEHEEKEIKLEQPHRFNIRDCAKYAYGPNGVAY